MTQSAELQDTAVTLRVITVREADNNIYMVNPEIERWRSHGVAEEVPWPRLGRFHRRKVEKSYPGKGEHALRDQHESRCREWQRNMVR